ncbi:MAG: hypothetical protein A2X13_14615 [Bacteroidetes bacterium GWC2_33_15]|nr:MAG: hypothetical protein A2X10_12660 [Bacteroidetes bacterium GWA2_33_15]OFX50105.1 MAG: hypothetical protein A2X13_14615 [Bacteroidetes bacterium GWC2_33_15]OFX65258.1 MAG: hypothetical protein A2X15_04190 [Bacteroidetes bacterium GWB2_32_14]OFX70484.1 MAG: hypothetical protein A2X14_04245 [Bacteroidetes bacterium GWD2_33_33]HAN19643.1 hypothetical protein [Bacteroidales bacterium]
MTNAEKRLLKYVSNPDEYNVSHTTFPCSVSHYEIYQKSKGIIDIIKDITANNMILKGIITQEQIDRTNRFK